MKKFRRFRAQLNACGIGILLEGEWGMVVVVVVVERGGQYTECSFCVPSATTELRVWVHTQEERRASEEDLVGDKANIELSLESEE